ncbi:exopolysaccharide biosynthesis protein [Paenibacillus yonginensis]|uniref:Exopolysaccharide biosynthesis protein n=1 Tax=Paenibacillus yonginensis TaxID=1462996 RepID=A0A1B1MYH0_9BACL|nr:polysaccharide pyruvyl transferase family protein [Paenibacillus yonginensis]ANS74230.1 exopolysaccharide biosynthesis protein [Paenibacillus yonginensis]
MHPMAKLKEKLAGILEAIPAGSNIYYVDYPLHNNGGDMLIMKGTEKFFKDYGIRILARYNLFDFPEDLKPAPGSIFVLHGGGNFGDLYVHHQEIREQVVKRFPDHRVVVMPQTIYFSREANYDRSAAIFNAHPDLHLFVRDQAGYELAKRKFNRCRVYLSPDMAHQLWPILPNTKVEKDRLYFLRTDIEAGDQPYAADLDPRDCRDWDSLFTHAESRVTHHLTRFCRLDKKLGGSLPTRLFWYKYTDYLLGKAVKLFGSYREIHTSRLHGHILACLMDKPHVLIDNSYGKNSQYYRTWTCGFSKARLVQETPDEPIPVGS